MSELPATTCGSRRQRPAAGALVVLLAVLGVVLLPGGTARADDPPDAQKTLTVTIDGSGSGAVGSCAKADSPCSSEIDTGTVVPLTAAADDGSVFTGWSGDCGGTDPSCSVTMDADRSATATFGFNLTVTVAGAAGGSVRSDVGGIDCGSTCTAAFSHGEAVALTAVPNPGAVFQGWGGACSGTGACSVTVDAAKAVAATFAYPLSVARAGDGSGRVTADAGGIDCGSACSAAIVAGTVVTLTATADDGSSFAGWTGDADCASSGATCQVPVDRARTVTATFAGSQSLGVLVSGAGTVTSSPAGIDCGSTCTARFPRGTTVTLTATPAAGATFAGWTGACSGTAPTCTVTAGSGGPAVGAGFTSQRYTLTVLGAGSGSGTVTSAPAGVDCGRTCTFPFDSGTSVTLTATPAPGSTFTGWTGDCSGTSATCKVVLDGNKAAAATFTAPETSVTVTSAGTGAGRVTSLPAGVDCGSTCTSRFAAGASVTLTALAATGSVFGGWGGACSGTSTTCTVSAAAGKTTTVTALFNRGGATLTVTRSGTGTGRVASTPAGIDCGAVCSASVSGTSATLTATADDGSTFSGWTGACTGTSSTCTVSLTGAASVTATFTKNPATVVGTPKPVAKKPAVKKPAAKKVALRARVLQFRTIGARGKRRLLLRLTLSAPATASLSLSLLQPAKKVAGHAAKTKTRQLVVGRARLQLKAGQRRLILLIPKKAQTGKLALRIVLVSAHGSKVTLNRRITLR